MGTRKLLREGLLLKAKSGRRLRGFLCSDILVLTDESAKSLYRMVRAATDLYVLALSDVTAHTAIRSPNQRGAWGPR